jgi:ribose transport system permease protein
MLVAYLATLAILLLTSVLSPGFLAGAHLRSMAMLAAFIGIVALGQTFVIMGGGVDLSVPWVLNGAAVFVTLFARGQNQPLLWAVPLLLGAGACVGMINGLGISVAGVPPIIMTLAVNVILQGAVLISTGGAPTAAAPTALQFLAVGRIAGMPVVIGMWLLLTLAGTVFLSKTAAGRHLYALGTNPTVAEYSGVPTLRTTVLSYALSGFAAALVGMLLTGYSGQAYLGLGDPYLFTSIAAVAVGGTSMMGGSGHYMGTIAGACLLTILAAFLPAMNLFSGVLTVVVRVCSGVSAFITTNKSTPFTAP